MIRWSLSLLLFVSGSLLGGAPAHADGPRTIVAEHTLLPDGTLARGLAIVIASDGTIERVVPTTSEDLPLPKVEYGPGSVITPGLHELLSNLGAPGEIEESVEPFDIFATACAAIDPLRRDLDRALAGGVLHATVAPLARNPVSGRAVTFSTGASKALKIVPSSIPHGPFSCAVGESALDPNRDPTSRSGLRLAFENWLRERGRELFSRDAELGVAPPLVHCTEAMDVRTALDLFTDRFPTLVLRAGATEAAALLSVGGIGRGEPIVVGPFTARSSIPELRGTPRLVAAGFELAFRGAMPAGGEESLRDTARRAVSQGLDAAAARRAMTVNPARVVGLAGVIGSIAPGCRADLAVFTGDPLLATSRPFAVIEGGAPRTLPSLGAPRSGDVIPEHSIIPEIKSGQEKRR